MKEKWLQITAEQFNVVTSAISYSKLAGDASTRQYWRLKFNNSLPFSTLLLMWIPDNESYEEPSFINVGNYLREIGVKVPEIYLYEPAENIILLEDCSDNLLQNVIQNKNEEEILKLYELALEEIFKMQFSAGKKGCLAHTRAFDTEKFLWELNFFKKHTLLQHLGISLTKIELEILNRFFLDVAQFLSEQPRYFTHRDYHSRNLLVQNNQIKVIDFQDARMGPAVYDLVSLIYDAYIRLPKEAEDSLIAQFKTKHSDLSEQQLDTMLVQRSLKAAGTFGFMAVEKKNNSYLQYLPRVFDLAEGALEKYPEYKEANKLFKDQVFLKQ